MLRVTRISRIAICVFPLFLAASCQRFEISGQGTSSANRHVLFDFRQTPPEGSEPKPMPAAMLAAVFPKYSEKTGRCQGPASREHEPPRLLGEAEGAFTEVGASQTAYLLDPGGCETDPMAFGEERLAIFSGNKLDKVTRVSATQLLATFDLDLDGKREFLLAKSNTRGGLSSVDAHLLELQEKTYKVAENFGRVRFQDCSSSKDGTVTAMKLDYLPEVDPKTGATVPKLPRFAAEIYRSACPKEGQPLKWVRMEGVGGE